MAAKLGSMMRAVRSAAIRDQFPLFSAKNHKMNDKKSPEVKKSPLVTGPKKFSKLFPLFHVICSSTSKFPRKEFGHVERGAVERRGVNKLSFHITHEEALSQ